MEKVVFNQLAVEVTRRCNMACGHCLRGDAENIDLTGMDIDSVLDQTEAIGRLIITGGEPTLNMGAIQHIANGIARRGIPLMRVQIITNGLLYDERLVALAKRFSEIISLTQIHGYGNTEREPWRVSIGVSLDRFHEAPETCKKNYIRYKTAMKDFAEVLQVRHGNAPRNEGRAAALTDTVDYTFTVKTYMLQQIEVLSADHKPMCKFYDTYHLERPDQKVICCGIYLNAYGEVLPGLVCDTDYQCRGIRLCYAWEPIWDKVLEYNRAHERYHCTYCDDLRTKESYINRIDDKAKADRENTLVTDPSAQDEPSAEPMYMGDIRRSRVQMTKWAMPDNYKELERKASEKNYLPAKGEILIKRLQ